MIDVTGIDKVAFVKAVYALSVPQGMGILHARTGELDDTTTREIADAPDFGMDYVHGRACKMHLRQDGDRLLAPDTWYDHTDRQYDELLTMFGLSRTGNTQHGTCCNCSTCRT